MSEPPALTEVFAPLSRAQAELLVDAVMAREDLALSAAAHEDPDTGEWVFSATCAAEPDLTVFAEIARQALGGGVDFAAAPLDPAVDWVKKSLDGLRPVAAGGFYVHGSHDAEAVAPAGLIPIVIDAAQAFGTGHHETTSACLEAIDRVLKRSRPRAMLDLGTGTGVLAIALAKRTRRSVIASDIDPIAVATAAENVHRNNVGRLVSVHAAPGLDHAAVARAAPYDLIVANILMGPLVALAPAMARATSSGAAVILSGLLVKQAPAVLAAYARQGIVSRQKLERGDWATIILERM